MFENTPLRHRVRSRSPSSSREVLEPQFTTSASAAPSSSSSAPLTIMEMEIEAGMRPLPTPTLPPTPTPLAGDTDTGLDHITCLERTVCSNYVCCARQHPDLHALLEHFEEEHVLGLAREGGRVYPRDGARPAPTPSPSGSLTSLSPTPSSSSLISSPEPSPSSSSPSPPPSSSPSAPSSTSTLVRDRKPSLELPPVYTPFTPSLPVDPADPYGAGSGLGIEEIVDIVDPVYLHSYSLEILAPSDSRSYGLELSLPEIEWEMDGEIEPSSPSSISASGSGSDGDGDEEMSDATSGGSGGRSSVDPHNKQTFVYATDKITPIAVVPKHVSFASGSPSSSSNSAAAAAAGPSSSSRKSGQGSTHGRAQGTGQGTGPTQGQGSGSAKPRGKYRTAAGNPSRKREKMYKCPRARCTKAYLNPNGLKYHLEKGTCKLRDEDDDGVEHDQDTSDAVESVGEGRRGVSSGGGGGGDVQMLETRHQHQSGGPPAASASFPPRDSNSKPSALTSNPLTINYIDTQRQGQGQGPSEVASTSAASASSSSSSGAGPAGVITSSLPASASLAPNQAQAPAPAQPQPLSSCQPQTSGSAPAPTSAPAPVYHYPVPMYPQPSFLASAGTTPAALAQYATTGAGYYHRPYYTGSGVDGTGALYLSSVPATAQPPMLPLAVSSLSMQ